MYPGSEKEYYAHAVQAQTPKSTTDTISTVMPRLMSLAHELVNGTNAIAESLRGGIPEQEGGLSYPLPNGLVGSLLQIENLLRKSSNLAQEAHSILN